MRKRRKELDVDVIGNQEKTITKKEEKMISDYIRSHRMKKPRKTSKKKVGA